TWLLAGTLGMLGGVAPDEAAAVDTSQWKCESCPFEQGTSGTVEVAPTYVSEASNRFGDFSGLDRKGGYLLGNGSVRYRNPDGTYADAAATVFGQDAASVSADAGREGLFRLNAADDALPRHLSEDAMSPFLGNGGSTLTLPAGYPAATTGAMPLASTLQPVNIGYKRSWLDFGGAWQAADAWTVRASVRHMVREGTEPTSGSSLVDAAQLVAPLDQTTDRIQVSGTYSGRRLQATLGYEASLFRNSQDALTWTNPFTVGAIGATSGQLALPPDNEFHQVRATLGYQVLPNVRASADLALGRMTQNAPFLASTLIADLVVPALPATSLQGRVDTLNANVRVSASPTERVRIDASYVHDEHDNRTPSSAYPSVSADMFVGPLQTNQPYSFTHDQVKLGADYRAPHTLKVSAGIDYDAMQRTLQEVGTTHEVVVYARLSAQPVHQLALALKLSHGDRTPSDYHVVASIDPAENPLLRQYNMARRLRDSVGGRADYTVSESVAIGFDVDWSNDNYSDSAIGLTTARTLGLGADASLAIGAKTRLQAFGHTDRIRSNQAGSQLFATSDWAGRNNDAADVIGIGVRHTALADKLELGGDLSYVRTRSDVNIDTGAFNPPFPTASTGRDTLKLFATWRLRDNLTLTGTYWYEHYDARDWQLDGVMPGTVPNLLAFGELPPHYNVQVLRLAMRYRF
ncbi:MAG: MtrB/PioB family decaheme-associated outer membrane protein, partial [Caldimonas sp.]